MKLADDFDGFLFDLDGVTYLGSEVIPAAPATIAALRDRGRPVAFVTNNAGSSPEQMAKRIQDMGIPCSPQDIVTSAQAIVTELARQIEPGARVLVVGSDFLAAETERAGFRAVRSGEGGVDAVVQGWGVNLDQPLLAEGCYALAAGAAWFVSNTDRTIPGERGLGPGSGSFVALLSGVTGREPDVIAGKPHGPLFRAGLDRLDVRNPIFTGDRLDTDIEGANALGLATLWVLSGAHGKRDLVQAPPQQRPRFIARDLGGLLDEPLRATSSGDGTVTCGDARARLDGGRLVLEPGGDPVAALWALATLAWAHPNADHADALDGLDLN